MANLRVTLSARIRLQMQRLRMDRPTLIEQSGLSKNAISRLMRCDVGASVDSIEKLADALGVDAFMLLVPIPVDSGDSD